MKERINSFDLIRLVCAWIVVITHFAYSCIVSPTYISIPALCYHANGLWGEITAVSVFFFISGASLYYNHPEVKLNEIPKFYWGRFKGIFPMFYLLWIILYLEKVIQNGGNWLYKGGPKNFLLTLVGMDGYLGYRFTEDYYIIGEWFLGGLVILYLLYPLMTYVMKKPALRWLFTVIITIALIVLAYKNPFQIPVGRNLIVCIFSMWFGMMFIEYRLFLSKTVFAVVFGILFVLLIFVAVPIPNVLSMLIMSIGIFLVINQIADYVMKPAPVGSFVRLTSKLSYPIFLLQHVVMDKILNLFTGKEINALGFILVLILTFAVIYVLAWILDFVNKKIVKSAPFKAVDKLFAR